ncbi:MAG: DNA polymerase IV, partial [Bacteroidales bacterium]|nr:DNA polymerase IV [Bacteroidales bacterium]
GKPVVVGSPSARGVIAAASYEARKVGVRSAMPSSVAMRLCASLLFVKGRMGRYKEVSGMIFDIFHSFTDIVEPLSVDEAFLDMSSSAGSISIAAEIAVEIKESIKCETGLNASAGISFNKFFAKIASDLDKPDGLFIIDENDANDLILRLPIDKFFGIGRVTASKMHLYGIHTGADLQKVSRDFLVRNFGKAGDFYFDICRGIDNRPVDPDRERKSVGAEITFENDLKTKFQIIAELYNIEKEVWSRVEKHGKSGRTLTVKVKFDDFTMVTKSSTLEKKISDFKTLHAEVTRIRENIDFHRKKIRLLGVTISNLGDNKPGTKQMELWNDMG